MNQKICTKLLASLLVVTLTFANFIMLGAYASNTYGTEDNLEKQETITNNANVVFDAYFKDKEGNITHTVREDMASNDLRLYAKVEVKRGYLKNATIQILGENETSSNIAIKNSSNASENIEAIDTSKNTITLKQINTGMQIVLEIPVVACKEDIYDLSNFSKLNNIVLRGNYIGDNGKETKIVKTIKTRAEWKAEIAPVLEQQLIRFIPYVVGEKNGTILQTLVKSGINENVLPIEETKLVLQVPQINGKNPDSVNVIPNAVLGTNGMKVEDFNESNWNYNKDQGTITILIKNEANENRVSWLKNIQDEFVVTYTYNEKVDTIQATQKATLELKAYNSIETKISKEAELVITQNEVLGQIVTVNIAGAEALSKGYLYTNVNRETIYNQNLTIDISYPELVDILNIEQNIDYFVNDKGQVSPTTYQNKNYAYYKSTKISKANFESILGKEGNLKILTLDGNELVTFNKDTAIDENGNYVYNYANETNQIKIQTTRPVKTGKLEIVHEKALKGNTDYNKKQVESFKTLDISAKVQAFTGSNIIAENEAKKSISLIAPTTKIEAKSSNENLSTVVTNENVELRVILKTNDITCDLYKNPTIEIVLPNYIKQINIKDINLLFDDELAIKEYNTYINETGNIVINVALQGEQTKYSGDEVSKGANLIINADIMLKNLTPTKNDVMKVYVINELVTTYENSQQQTVNKLRANIAPRGYSEVALNAVAPVGIVATTEISGYNEKNERVTSINGNEVIGKLDVKKARRIANVNMNVINNYQNKVNNMVVLGRILTNSSKNADTLQDFSSNLESTMSSALNVTGAEAEIYYSTNESATNDLSLDANGWTKNIENIKNVKSYLIVVKGDIETGTTLGFSYNLNIPENLSYDTKGYSNYVVYFDNVKETETIKEKAVSATIGLETGKGPELEVNISSDVGSNDVQEGQIITYTVTVKNIGKSEAKNVTVTSKIPEKTIYTYFTGAGEGEDPIRREYDTNKKTYSELIENISVGETKEITYQVKTGTLGVIYDENGNVKVDEYTISNNAKAVVEGYDEVEFATKTIKNKLVQGYINIKMKVARIPAEYVRAEGDELTYELEIENASSIEKKNLTLKTVLPEGVTYKSSTNSGSYNEQTRELTWNIEKLLSEEWKQYSFTATIDKLQNNVYEKTIKTYASVIGEKTVNSNETAITVKKAKLTIKQTSETQQKVSVGDTIIYNFEITNIGKGYASLVQLTDAIPEGLTYEIAQYSYNGKTINSKIGTGDVAKIIVNGLKEGETLNVSIKAIAEELEDGANERKVTNKATVIATGLEEVTSNEITHTIVEKQASIDDPSIDEPIEGTHTISGIAWLDENGNGKRDENEKRMAGIPVILIDAQNGQIVKDIKTGKEKKQETNSNGRYTFANLKDGTYMVVFLYNSGDYGITLYKQEGVNEDQNSDAVQVNVIYEGTSRVAGASDKLNLLGENIANIDIGLTNSPKFDLKLDKVISSIVVSDANGTDVYEYKDEKLAKLDLNSKRAIGSTIIVEYKIRVTNEGGVAGYAKKIVDYMPSGMKFNSELNKDWYASNNGANLYNSSLANELIQPGETKEITLLLSKKITESNMGIINNTAEIAESYNDLGLSDIDSTPANKVQNEDDLSSADVIIGTKTGEVYLYITLTLVIISMLGVGIYLINKKVLKRG